MVNNSSSLPTDQKKEEKTLKTTLHKARRIFINILVDAASVIEIAAAATTASIALLTLYSSYYHTLGLPTPESFSAASTQLAASISFIFAVFFTRKYYVKEATKESSDPPK